MFTGLIAIPCLAAVCWISYSIGKLHGYDEWDKENEPCK